MKQFHYSLQRVLDVRDAVVSRCESRLAESERDLNALGRDRRQCDEAVQAAADEAEKTLGQAKVSSRDCIWQRTWFHHMADRLRSSIRAEKKQQSVVRSRRESLCKAMTDLRVMESMSKRERLEWMAQWQDAERKTMDESATMVFLRKTGNQKAHAEWTQNGESPA